MLIEIKAICAEKMTNKDQNIIRGGDIMLKQSLQAIGFLVAIVCLLNSSPLFAQSPPDTLWTKAFGGTDKDWGESVCQTSDGGYIIAGYTSSYGAGGFDVYLIKINAEPIEIDNQESLPSCSPFLQNYPNPFNSKTSIKYSLSHPGNVQVEIYNIKGQLVETLLDKDTSIGFHTIEWDAQDMTLGIYFCKLVADKKETVKKMVLIML